MDPISAGASVLAFVGVALSATKATYQVVSGIKNGPQQVLQIASAVQNLQSVLAQLSSCRAIREADAQTDLNSLTSLVQACIRDLSGYEESLKSLRIFANEKKTGKALKWLKSFLREKDLLRMKEDISRYVADLGIQLHLLQS
jgi:Fungal N-terminal domain of STAND proteins